MNTFQTIVRGCLVRKYAIGQDFICKSKQVCYTKLSKIGTILKEFEKMKTLSLILAS